MATLYAPSRYVAVDGNGKPYAAAQLGFYVTGTTTPATVYSNPDLDPAHALTNPVVADGNGLFPAIYLDATTTYKAVLTDANNATIWTTDPISSLTSAAIVAALGYTPGNPAASATSYLAADVNLNNVSTRFAGPNTGAIGAAGQKWAIIFQASVTDTAGAASFFFEINNGSSTIHTGGCSTGGANFGGGATLAKVVTLSGPTTFTGKAADLTSTSGVLAASSDANATKFATSITAIRLS